MSGEKSVLSGIHGQKVIKKFLGLLGWDIGEQVHYDCFNSSHKTASGKKKQNHDIDGIFQNDSPLNHQEKHIVFISSKHNVLKYDSNRKGTLNNAIKDLAKSLSCGPSSDILQSNYIGKTEKKPRYLGLLFMLSSSQEQKHYDLIAEQADSIITPKIEKFDTIYIVDNKRITFLYSAFETARQHKPNAKLKWLFHHTGHNQDPECIITSGKVAPVETIASSILPIVLETKNMSSLLLFTDIPFDKKHLKRIIWLVHKIGYGFSEIIIFFEDYDETINSNMVVTAKQEFRDIDFLRKIVIKKYDFTSFIKLKESGILPFPLEFDERNEGNKPEKVKINEKNIDKILPYGEMLKPMLSSSQLSNTDLKSFLNKKGIITKSSDKKNTVPIFASLILSPKEIDELRDMLIVKEDKPKLINKISQWITNLDSLNESIFQVQDTIRQIRPSTNCKLVNQPRFTRKSESKYELQLELERTNTTKDLLTGVTLHKASIIVEVDNDVLYIKLEYSTNETKKFCDKIVKKLNDTFLNNKNITKEAKSILFSEFANNEQRVNYLLSFQKMADSKCFLNSNISNIKFKPDSKIGILPSDLEPMKDRVSNLNINGNDLDNLSYVKNQKYKECILLEKIKISFNFKLENEKGVCIADIGFPSTLNSKKVDYQTEFQTSVELPKISENKHFSMSKTEITSTLARKLSDIAINKYYELTNKEQIRSKISLRN